MPGSKVVGVVALVRVACSVAEVVEVGFGPFWTVVVVARDGPGALLELAPGGIVALGVLLSRSMLVGEVAQGEDCVGVDALDEPGGCLVALAAAVGDVTSRYNQHSGRVVAEEEEAINGNDDDQYDDHDPRCVERPQEPSRL